MKKNIFGLIICLCFISNLFSQKRPFSYVNKNVQINKSIENVSIPLVKKSNLENNKDIVGRIINFNKNCNVSGAWTKLNEGDKIWQLQMNFIEESYIILYFDTLKIPNKGELFLYSNNDSLKYNSILNYTKNQNGKIATQPIKAKSLTIEYYEPQDVSGKLELNISKIGILFTSGGFGSSLSCQTNVGCSDIPNGYCYLRRSVAVILKPDGSSGYIRSGTGSLINNSSSDFHPYFITASHLLDGNESQWIFAFNYESPSCDNIDKDIFEQTIVGANVLASENQYYCDCALLELKSRPIGEFNPYYNGWLILDGDPITAAMIHHPRGDIKKIAYATKIKDPILSVPRYWIVKDWENGVAEGGSSGAPYYNSEYLVAIQSAVNGKPSCSDYPDTYIQKFYKAWDKLNLENWLYPSPPSNLVGISGADPCVNNYVFSNRDNLHSASYDGYYSASDYIEASNTTIKSGTSVTFDAGNRIRLGSGFKIEVGATFKAQIGGCVQVCNSSLKSKSIENNKDLIITQENIPNAVYSSYLIKDNVTNQSNYEHIINHTVFPNPNNGIFQILLNTNLQLTISIYDYIGNIVYNNTYNTSTSNIEIDLSIYPKGLYIVYGQSNSYSFIEKILYQYN